MVSAQRSEAPVRRRRPPRRLFGGRRSLPPPGSAERLGSDGLTPRQREVFARPPGPEVLADLARERPGAPRPGLIDVSREALARIRCCIVCWRDMPTSARPLTDGLACDAARGAGALDGPCTLYVRRCFREQTARSEASKASVLAEVCHD